MFNFLGWMIKATLFAAGVLVLGSVLHIGGKTVSEQVKNSLSGAETPHAPIAVVQSVKTWTSDIADKTKRAAAEFKKPVKHQAAAKPVARAHVERAKPAAPIAVATQRKMASKETADAAPRKPLKIIQSSDPNNTESILASERQELRTLIRDLNNSTEKLTAN